MNSGGYDREELWPAPRRGGSGADLLDVEEGQSDSTVRTVIDEADTSGPVTAHGDGEPPIIETEDWEHRPDRNWFLLVAGILCVVLGVRATYVGIRVLTTELDHPLLNWFTDRGNLT